MTDSHRPAIESGMSNAALGAAVLAMTFVGLTGCDRHPTATKARAPAPAAPTLPEPEQPVEQPAPVEEVVSVELSQENLGGVAIHETAGPEASQIAESLAESAESAPSAPFRLLLPTTAGPLLVDLDIQVGDQPLLDAFASRIDSIVQQAGGTDALTWTELFEYVAANPQVFGRAPVDSQQYRNMIRMYDRNRNELPEPDEVAHFLFRDTGTSGPFRMFGSNFFRLTNRTHSPMFQVMDRNGNHQLDTDEIQLAYESLSELDRNGDRRIDITEVLPTSGGNLRTRDAWNNRHASRWGDVAMDLSGFVDWSMVSYSLDEASRQGIFHDGLNAVAMLDQNGDEAIDADESRRLLEVPADLRLRIQFASGLSTEPRIDVELPESDDPTAVQIVELGDRVRIVSSRFQLTAVVRDLHSSANAIPPEAFAALDADKDPISPLWTVQVRSRGAEAPDAIFTWLDQDQNGLLATRELLDCSERLQGLASKQGEIRPTDIPDTFLIQFGRGDPQQDETLFALVPVATKRNDSWPRWAEAMDSNQDGDISREEFLGPIHLFDQVDRNRDGFLNGTEIE